MTSMREETYESMWRDFNLKEIDKGRERSLKLWLEDGLKWEEKEKLSKLV